jgi:hypothetical protein
MVKCDNCSKKAEYTCADPGVNPVNYCSLCLPAWLQHRAVAGHFPLVQPVEDEENNKVKSSKSKKA